MNRTRELQSYVDGLARLRPVLAGAKVIYIVQNYEVWLPESEFMPSMSVVTGSYATILLWLGCVALTGEIRNYDEYPMHISIAVLHSAERAGVLR